jgi:hypothetical protein
MNTEQREIMDRMVALIAQRQLGLETLLTRNSDSLDFHDLAVWSVKAALEAAFSAGMAAANKHRK